MSKFKFTGLITDVMNPRTGDNWASIDFEVTETDPENPDYPNIAKFSLFKSGDYVHHAEDFANKHPIGTLVEVDFNFKKNEYTKGGEEKSFYSLGAWKVKKLEDAPNTDSANEPEQFVVEGDDDLPF